SAPELDRYIDAGEVLVAVTRDEVIGHLQLLGHRADDHSEIKNMAVDARYRNRGGGRLLIEAAIDVARSHGHSTLTVATAAADVGSLRFYQRVGFRMRDVERDAFLGNMGYPAGLEIDGIQLRDRVWLDLELDQVK